MGQEPEPPEAVDTHLAHLTAIRAMFSQLEVAATSFYMTARSPEGFDTIGQAYRAALEVLAEGYESFRCYEAECPRGFCCVRGRCVPCDYSTHPDELGGFENLLGRVGLGGGLKPPEAPGGPDGR